MDIESVLEKHKLWLSREELGERANLRGANLRKANLRKADLSDADLRFTNLRGAYLIIPENVSFPE